MKQDSTLTRELAQAQEAHAADSAVVYRLYTEDTGQSGLASLVAEAFDGFTLYLTAGYWRGMREPGVMIEIIGSPSDRSRVLTLAESIRRANHQQSVLVTSSPVVLTDVTAQSHNERDVKLGLLREANSI